MNLVDEIEKENLKKDVPTFDVGDTVKVYVKVVEAGKERLQAYEGIVTAKRNGSIRESFTVRRISYGVGVERTFPLHSPRIDRVEVLRHGRVRRAKLYYLQNRKGKSARVPENRTGKDMILADGEVVSAEQVDENEGK
jgi:large subunit ribosomal protein L19